METAILLSILNRIKGFVENDSLNYAKDLTKMELENLKGITEENCRSTRYYFYDSYCKYCRNLNCNSNKNKQ